MLKTDSPFIQASFQPFEVEVDPERRAFLARKGQRLYGKYCGTDGHGICAESFAEYHIWRGEYSVARDLLAFLNTELDVLRKAVDTDPKVERQLELTLGLIDRIQNLLGDDVPAAVLNAVP